MDTHIKEKKKTNRSAVFCFILGVVGLVCLIYIFSHNPSLRYFHFLIVVCILSLIGVILGDTCEIKTETTAQKERAYNLIGNFFSWTTLILSLSLIAYNLIIILNR